MVHPRDEGTLGRGWNGQGLEGAGARMGRGWNGQGLEWAGAGMDRVWQLTPLEMKEEVSRLSPEFLTCVSR